VPIVGHHDDRAAEGGNQPLKVLPTSTIQVRLRLVEQERVWPADETGGQRHHLALPPGQVGRGRGEGPLLQPQAHQERPDLTVETGSPHADPSLEQLFLPAQHPLHPSEVAGQRRRCQLGLTRSKLCVEIRHLRPGLEHRADRVALVPLHLLGQVGRHTALPVGEQPAFEGLQAGQHSKERGLPGAVRADHADARLFGHVEVDAAEHRPRAVGLVCTMQGHQEHGNLR
jgi:hypothetical protein